MGSGKGPQDFLKVLFYCAKIKASILMRDCILTVHYPFKPFLIFDFVDETNTSQQLIFSRPIKIILVNCVDQIDSALREVQAFVNQGYYAAGYISYEAAPAFDPAFVVAGKPSLPLLWFGIFKNPDDDTKCNGKGTFHFESWQPHIRQEQYNDAINRIKAAISRGETYQVNYTMRLRSRFAGDQLACYQHLREVQQAGYSAYLNIGRFQILSFSPELFFRLHGQNILTRPMKGTVKRGRWQAEDEANVVWLKASEKNRAENLMIVDLLRNDLSRIAETGSIHVPRLFEIETYPTVHQMTSTVSATLRSGISWLEVFQSLFPCGSITGAPKVSTMKLIAELEDEPREVYCGAIGVIDPEGNAVFNVAIRTLFIDNETGEAEFGTGGGITWDSAEHDEYNEAILKAEFLRQEPFPFQLLETIKLDHGEYVLLNRHMERLDQSARFFRFAIDLDRILQALDEHAHLYLTETRRVRLLVEQNGTVQVESTVLQEPTQVALPVCLAQTPVNKGNRFLYHKTTNRSVYESHLAQNPGVFDVLLWNENREITEFTRGNIVVELGNAKFTPSIECGLLSGTFRAQLLADGVIAEKVLTLEDLKNAQQLWFINSVREWMRVHLVR